MSDAREARIAAVLKAATPEERAATERILDDIADANLDIQRVNLRIESLMIEHRAELVKLDRKYRAQLDADGG